MQPQYLMATIPAPCNGAPIYVLPQGSSQPVPTESVPPKQLSKNQKKKLHYSKVAKSSMQTDLNVEGQKTGGPAEGSRDKKVSQPAERQPKGSKHQKREKIFIDIESAFMAGKNLEGVREDTGRGGQIQEATANEKRQVAECQRIKFLDLAKFKVEKCRNLASGKQHNHKHCRYFHTDKDQR